MKTFYLKTKESETIAKQECSDFECAVIYFSEMKKLKEQDLLNIFIISE